jgi:hypothetical protein
MVSSTHRSGQALFSLFVILGLLLAGLPAGGLPSTFSRCDPCRCSWRAARPLSMP